MTRTVAALAVAALTLTATTAAQASITRGYWTLPRSATGCYQRTPPERCLLRWWVRRTWHAEDRRGMPRTPFARADLSPSVPYMRWAKLQWRARAIHVLSLPVSPWPAWWLPQAMCVHSHEASWTNPTGIGPQVSGGMQIGLSEWIHFGGGAYAPAAYLAPPRDQLTVAWRYYAAETTAGQPGWSPWPNTARMCGLL